VPLVTVTSQLVDVEANVTGMQIIDRTTINSNILFILINEGVAHIKYFKSILCH